MSYLVLARKYRPRRFEDMVGQEVVTGVLRGAIEDDRVGHAYLFAGPRGTGKTTTARILAKALNCVKGPTPDPCGECERCLASDEGAEFDVIEIDAASNTSVNDVRELRESVGYAPVDSRYKVYIVDEVHMLSRAAFNALLKTLEEPPSHVKFLFATTELHKVPDTILSRCQVMRLSPIREEQIAGRLATVFDAEGVTAADGVAAELARRARGGMRDALSLADQLLALAGNSPQLADLARLSGGAGLQELLGLVDALGAGDRAAALDAVAAWAGREGELAGALLDVVRSIVVAGVCGAGSPHLEGGPAAGEALLARAKALGRGRLELMLADLIRARERMRHLAGSERVVLESALLELCTLEATMSLAELEARLASLEARLGGASVAGHTAGPASGGQLPVSIQPTPPPVGASATRSVQQPTGPATGPATAPGAAPRSPDTPQPAPGPAAAPALEPWKALVGALDARHRTLADLLRRSGKLQGSGSMARILVSKASADEQALLADKRSRRACERALSGAMGREITVEFVVGDAATPPPPKVEQDPFTRQVADLFDGHIEEP
ncbi:DNA polymerase III subunit gamma/tau [Engelhardtia mirabilis]|uniref:DNA polymerase III subunit gamma/tau n=1 Tax=Engelhardtia mirabilis TaxID=2528011 RepID=A0A518BPA6_9BACT|nr:DNA polymerase III subunit tau [Planctomycetes bacterium Pla133]QDV03137.1 DNA polymerase III subunit tau [Planctomycetes bacterium Pla86]